MSYWFCKIRSLNCLSIVNIHKIVFFYARLMLAIVSQESFLKILIRVTLFIITIFIILIWPSANTYWPVFIFLVMISSVPRFLHCDIFAGLSHMILRILSTSEISISSPIRRVTICSAARFPCVACNIEIDLFTGTEIHERRLIVREQLRRE